MKTLFGKQCLNALGVLTIFLVLRAGSAAAEIVAEQIVYQGDGRSLHGYLVYDDASDEKRPGVIVVHEWWGLNEYAKRRARDLAALGYVALAIDMYGKGKTADHPSTAQEFSKEAMSSMDAAQKRFMAGVEVLKKFRLTNPDQIAAIGYCFGGGTVLQMARAGVDLAGVASFHGMLKPMVTAEPGSIKAKILVFNGESDPFVPAEDVEALKAEMKTAGADFEYVGYPDAKHSFTNSGADKAGKEFNLPLVYNAAADRDSWEKMQAFFKKIFVDGAASK